MPRWIGLLCRATSPLDDLIDSKRTGRLQDAANIEVLEAIREMKGL